MSTPCQEGLSRVATARLKPTSVPAGMVRPVRLMRYSCTSSGVGGMPGLPQELSLYCRKWVVQARQG